MSLVAIEQLIPETFIEVFAPHYDDTLFMMGGIIEGWKAMGLLDAKRLRTHLLFSNSNYQARQDEGNRDTSTARVQFATGVRLIEDRSCLDELLGEGDYRYELHGLDECFVRGKSFADSEMEFPHGQFEDFDEKDWRILDDIETLLLDFLTREDTALVLPLAIKEHVDHFIVREAGIRAIKKLPEARAKLYFVEDKPYGGLATAKELARSETFVETHGLEVRAFAYDPDLMLEYAFKHYPSQVEDCYRKGILGRAEDLKRGYASKTGVDRLFVHP